MAVLDLVQWTDQRPDEIVHRVPQSGSGEFALGSQLVVREAQNAVFARDGKALDTFEPGRFTLSTKNLPLLTGLIGLPFGGKSPFTAEVYFVAMKEFTGQKWGTPEPLVFRDADLGAVRLRAFGIYSFRVAEPALFVNAIVGAAGGYGISSIDDYLRGLIVSTFNDVLGSTGKPLYDIAGSLQEIGAMARAELADDFQRIGLELMTFQVVAIAPTEEVQKRIDERSGMAAIGDLGAYTQFQAAQAMREAAQNEGGGMAGAGVGLGAGMVLGQQMAGALSGQQPSGGGSAAPATVVCPHCQATVSAGAKFCSNCGKPLQNVCPQCGVTNPPGAKFCSNCGENLSPS